MKKINWHFKNTDVFPQKVFKHIPVNVVLYLLGGQRCLIPRNT